MNKSNTSRRRKASRINRLANFGDSRIEPLERRTLLSGWSTVDAVTNGTGVAIAADGMGNVYTVVQSGLDTNTNTYVDMVREKTAGAAGWSTIAESNPIQFNTVTTDRAGDVFIGCHSSTTNDWIILERPAGKTAFATIDDVAQGSCSGLATDAAGNIYASGILTVATSKHSTGTYLAVQRGVYSAALGKWTFITVDQTSGGGASAISVIGSGPSAGIYLVGGSTGSASQWIVRKSTDGIHFAQVDGYFYDPSIVAWSHAFGVAPDAAGDVYVSGIAEKATLTGYTKNRTPTYSYAEHWIARKSADGGAHWTVNDDYQLAASVDSEAYAVTTDLGGNVYVAGDAEDAVGWHGIVRTNSGGTWHTIDNYLGEDGLDGLLDGGLAVDTAGNVYAAGWDLTQSIVRELNPLMATMAPVSIASGVVSTSVVFNRPVTGLDLSDLTLTTPGGGATDLAGTDSTLSTSDGMTYVLALSSGLTQLAGGYTLSLAAAGSGITDANAMSLSNSASQNWLQV